MIVAIILLTIFFVFLLAWSLESDSLSFTIVSFLLCLCGIISFFVVIIVAPKGSKEVERTVELSPLLDSNLGELDKVYYLGSGSAANSSVYNLVYFTKENNLLKNNIITIYAHEEEPKITFEFVEDNETIELLIKGKENSEAGQLWLFMDEFEAKEYIFRIPENSILYDKSFNK